MRILAAPAFANRDANPYNSLLYSAVRVLGHEVSDFERASALRRPPDVLHLHWPESALNKPRRAAAFGRSLELLVVLAVVRLRGTRVVWTAHNSASHGRRYPFAERLFWRLLLPQLDGWIALSVTARDLAVARHPSLAGRPHAVVPHGHYRQAYPPPPPRPEARAALGLPDVSPVIAFVGRVKPYKGVEVLLRAFSELPEPSARLVIAGRCDDQALEQALRSAAATDERVELHLRALEASDVSSVLGATDLVALPYRDVLNSGSALLALSFDVPILVPKAGALVELAAELPSWVRVFEGDLTAQDLVAAIETARPEGTVPLGHLDWAGLAERTVQFYDEVRHGAR